MKKLKKSASKPIAYGEMFSLGDHILVCGDARDEKLLSKVFDKKKISLILTDPPYGVEYTESKEEFSTVKMNKKIFNDDITSENAYVAFTQGWLTPVIPHLSRKNTFYIFNCDIMLFALRDGMQNAGLRFSQLLIWIKNHAVIGRKDYLPMHELIAVGWYKTHKFHKAQDKTVLYYPRPQKSTLHPTQKPIGLLRRLILNSTSIGETIYDCFGGSGSTLIACEQTRRKCIMVEYDPIYCQTIIDRYKKIFNKKVTKI